MSLALISGKTNSIREEMRALTLEQEKYLWWKIISGEKNIKKLFKNIHCHKICNFISVESISYKIWWEKVANCFTKEIKIIVQFYSSQCVTIESKHDKIENTFIDVPLVEKTVFTFLWRVYYSLFSAYCSQKYPDTNILCQLLMCMAHIVLNIIEKMQ